MLLINAIIIMSTYCPKTLKGWKLQKRSLNDLYQQPQSNVYLTKSYIIHAFQSNKKHYITPSQPKKGRHRSDSNQTKSMKLSNGFKKFRRQDFSVSFSRVISDNKLIRINNFIKDYNIKRKAGDIIDKSPLKIKQRYKKIRMMRGEIRKKPIQNTVLNKILLIKTPSQTNYQQILFTDNEHPQLSQLENEEFSPYRSKRQVNQQNQQNILAGISTYKKQQQKPSENINFLSISQINIKHKQKYLRNKLNLRKRSFSVRQLKDHKQFLKNITKANGKGLIQPWQISQKYTNN